MDTFLSASCFCFCLTIDNIRILWIGNAHKNFLTILITVRQFSIAYVYYLWSDRHQITCIDFESIYKLRCTCQAICWLASALEEFDEFIKEKVEQRWTHKDISNYLISEYGNTRGLVHVVYRGTAPTRESTKLPN